MCFCQRDSLNVWFKKKQKKNRPNGVRLFPWAWVLCKSLLWFTLSLLNLWILCKSCYLVHDAPGTPCSDQISRPLPVWWQENPPGNSIPDWMHETSQQEELAMYVRSLTPHFHIHGCAAGLRGCLRCRNPCSARMIRKWKQRLYFFPPSVWEIDNFQADDFAVFHPKNEGPYRGGRCEQQSKYTTMLYAERV